MIRNILLIICVLCTTAYSAIFPATPGRTLSIDTNGIVAETNVTFKSGYFSTPIAYKGLISGDSTIATFAGGTSIDYFLLKQSDTLIGSTIYNQAVPGNTILQQQVIYLADADKDKYDWIIVEIGLNDLDPTEAAVTALARYQTYINHINTNKKPSAVVIISTMTPCKERLTDVYGPVNGLISYQKWLDMNIAILGGANAITNVSYRIGNHTELLGDGTGNLSLIYDTGDHIHENNMARKIIANTWRSVLNNIGFLRNEIEGVNDSIHIVSTNVGASSIALENANSGPFGYAQMLIKPYGYTGWNIGSGGSGETYFGVPGSLYFYDADNLAHRLVITPAGRIGIGTVSPLDTLSVVGSASISGNLGVGVSNSAYAVHIKTTALGASSLCVENTDTGFAGFAQILLKPSGYNGWNIGIGGIGETFFGVKHKAYLYDAQQLKIRAVVDTNGNVGIGTVSPRSTVSVDGNINFKTNSIFSWNVYNNGAWYYQSNGYGAAISLNPSGVLLLSTFTNNAAGADALTAVNTSFALYQDGTIQPVGYKSGDGSPGISETNSWSDGGATNWTMVIKNGLVTSLTHSP